MDRKHLLVWDLDGTLGDFSALQNCTDLRQSIEVRLRPGIRACLDTLGAAGFSHTLLTLGQTQYAETVLRGCGLRDAFACVEGHDRRAKADADGLAKLFAISNEQRPHRMLFIGDHPIWDAAEDPRIVFHFEPYGLTRSAQTLAALIFHLRKKGKGSLCLGFDQVLGGRWGWRRLPLLGGKNSSAQVQQRTIPGIGSLQLAQRPQAGPIIAFAAPSEPPIESEQVCFIPADMAR